MNSISTRGHSYDIEIEIGKMDRKYNSWNIIIEKNYKDKKKQEKQKKQKKTKHIQ